MGMGIDESRHQHVGRSAQVFARRKPGAHVCARQQSHDPAAVDGDRVMLEYAVSRLDWDDPACIDDEINGFHACSGGRCSGSIGACLR